MALNPTQKSDLLFKKVIAGKSTSNINKDYFEELVNSNKKILASSIWNQDNLIPTTNPLPYNTSTDGQFYINSGNNIIEIIKDLVLEPIQNSTAFYDPTNRLNNIIAYNFGDGSYVYKLKKNDNSTIALGESNWVFDNDSGVLTFFDGYPSGVSSTVKPKISAWKYVGTVGLSNVVSTNFIDTNYDDLISLRDSSGLQSGTYYRFQFNTKHNIATSFDDLLNTGDSENLIILALNTNTLSSLVYSESYPQDIIYIDLDDNLCEDGITLRSGNIIYRKDPIKNLETYYDWRSVKFRRYKLGTVNNNAWITSTSYSIGDVVVITGDGFYGCIKNHTSDTTISADESKLYWTKIFSFGVDEATAYYSWDPTSITIGNFEINSDPDDFLDFLTFNNTSAQNINIKYNSNAGSYNNIIFTGSGYLNGIYFENDCVNMTFRDSCPYNLFGSSNNTMIFLTGSGSNKLGYGCSGNIFSESSNFNIIGDNSTNLIFNSSSSNNFENIINSYLLNSNYNNFESNINEFYLSTSSYCNINSSCYTSYIKNMTYSNIGSNCGNIYSILGINKSSIINGTQNQTFLGILSGVNILIPLNTTTTITESYSNIVVDMIDTDGDLWYKTIDNEGRISTNKFV